MPQVPEEQVEDLLPQVESSGGTQNIEDQQQVSFSNLNSSKDQKLHDHYSNEPLHTPNSIHTPATPPKVQNFLKSDRSDSFMIDDDSKIEIEEGQVGADQMVPHTSSENREEKKKEPK